MIQTDDAPTPDPETAPVPDLRDTLIARNARNRATLRRRLPPPQREPQGP